MAEWTADEKIEHAMRMMNREHRRKFKKLTKKMSQVDALSALGLLHG